jgi:hypothetical protein
MTVYAIRIKSFTDDVLSSLHEVLAMQIDEQTEGQVLLMDSDFISFGVFESILKVSLRTPHHSRPGLPVKLSITIPENAYEHLAAIRPRDSREMDDLYARQRADWQFWQHESREAKGASFSEKDFKEMYVINPAAHSLLQMMSVLKSCRSEAFRSKLVKQILASYENKSNKVKRLPPSVVRDIELKNHARRLANLSPIRIRVRSCISCGTMFESAGNQTCGCNTRSKNYIAGREII